MRALPHTYRKVDAKDGALVAVTISGDSGGQWLLKREKDVWRLYLGGAAKTDAETIIDQEIAWRLFTKGISKEEALVGATLNGDRGLASKTLEMISVIA